MPNKNRLSLLLASSILAISLAACSQNGNAQSSGSTAPASESSAVSATPTGTAAVSASPSASPAETASAEPSGSPSASPSATATSAPQETSLGTPTALRMASFQSGWAGGAGWIARTDDGGKTWHTQYKHDYSVLQIFALNDQKAWATLDIGDAKAVKLVKTTDGGKTWSDAGKVPSYSFLHFVSDDEAFGGQ